MFRLFDIILSGVALVILSPLLVPLFVILRLTGEGEIFYRQLRVGFRSDKFYIYKFATMLMDSPNIGAGTLTMINDPRVLPVGAFLRKTKINELPQLLNIFIGDMSFVGPRPLVPEGEKNYTQDQARIIRSVRPGVTGVGSLILRDEESYYAHRTDAREFYIHVISPYKASLEIWYVNNRSIALSMLIMVATVFAVIAPSWDVTRLFSSLPDMPKEMADSRLQQ
ncbi:sugar transferase [Amylibacter sp.]|jgi:lipopolysaccharide/colanic/teichoic acid biosynthesis glycosyltransferase|nr:sugar transferase [Amylibacter sp.]